MGFIFPQLHPGFDAMFSIAKLIEMETLQGRSLGQIRAELPRVYHRCQTIRCPWTAKGALMRHMVETHAADRIELTDGVKVCEPQSDNWVLVLPDAGEPVVHIFANGDERDWVDRMLLDYRARIQKFVEQQQGGQNLPLDEI
jgi:mannose-1-phosphate guanylyltransferase/phosphomannomutase